MNPHSPRPSRLTLDVAGVFVVVISLVTILIRPILAWPERNDRRLCLDNLKDLSRAASLYISDWDASLPSSYLCGHSPTWNTDDFTRFARAQGSPANDLRSWPVVLHSYLNNNSSIWCPSDRTRSSSPTATVSYYWKAALDRAWYEGFRKEGDFEWAGSQAILYERNNWHDNGRNGGLADGALINCAFLDGHVATIQIRDSGYPRRASLADPLPASGVGEPAWFNYSFGEKTSTFDRGDNWNPHIWGDNLREILPTPEERADTCQDNLRRLALAVQIYANDWDGAIPSSCLCSHSQTWNPYDFADFASRRGDLRYPDSSSVTWPMLFYPYSRSEKVFWCPSDAGRSNDPSAQVSYYWKAAVDAAWFGGPEGTGRATRAYDDFLFPASQIVLYERSGWHWPGRGKGLADGVVINCAFLDGHVASKVIRNSGYGRREIPAAPVPASGIGEPAWFNYSFGSSHPGYNKGDNWDPAVWGDRL